ncbi:OmpP1/FadL family transporter [Dokdonia sp. R86516]|uniref:OmpP1/FadL family transporter n=1 Tax=Dokdonia sp. R86516 TaxID=3093856 RepID=UPI0037C74021
MKKLILIAALVATGTSFGQTISDALLYTSSNVTGTARYRAMGGAFGALGGDLSAIGDNPAASAVFTRGTVSLSIVNDNYDNDTRYLGNTTNVSDSDLSINQAGGVFIIGGSGNSKWNKVSLSFNYDRTSNLDNQYTAVGNNTNSISSYFSDFAQGVPLDLLETVDGESVADLYQFLGETEGFGAQQALLGFQSFVLDPVSNDLSNTEYFVNTVAENYDQEYIFASSGYSGKASFNIGAQYDENLYLGLNLNSHFIDYNQSTVLFESNNVGADEGFTNITDIRFENNLRTIGSGFSFQLGSIYKAGENLRVGFTYDLPTWTTISEETNQSISTTAIDDAGVFNTVINPRVTNIYEDYEIKTPGKYTGSVAYLFGQQGLLSFDYSYKDYTNLSFRPESDSFFNAQNAAIDNLLQPVNSYKLGGEIRSQAWSFRGGYRYEDSPFKDETTVGDLSGYSAGVGYNFGKIKLDVAYDTFSQERTNSLYSTGLTNEATVDRDNTSVIATLTVSL